MSVLGYGCWAFGGGSYWGEDHDQKNVDRLVRYAVDAGVTYFDTAEAYNDGRSEESLGRALKGIPRDSVVVGTKVLPGNAHPETLVRHCEESLKRLDLDHVDLYIVHWPLTPLAIGSFGDSAGAANPPVVDDVFATLMKLRDQGRIGHIGVSNFGVEFLREAMDTGAVVASNQVVYSLLSRGIEFEVAPFCREHGIGLTGYMTLLQGILADAWKSIDDIPPKQRRFRLFDSAKCDAARHGESGAEEDIARALDAIRDLCRETGLDMATLAVKWAIANEAMTCVLTGSRTLDHFRHNVEAARKPLDPAIKTRLDEITDPVKHKLGPSLDLFESADKDRSRVRGTAGSAGGGSMV